VSYTRYPTSQPAPATATGWDRWATDYAALGTNPTYALAKELLHELDSLRRVDNKPEQRTLFSKVKDIFQ
jgi:methenyltetrahydromethanopterin cyclohydrolase